MRTKLVTQVLFRIGLAGIALVAASAAMNASAQVLPRDGIWTGTTSQGFSIEFAVANGGTLWLPGNYGLTYLCQSGGNQSWGFGFGSFEVPITLGTFAFTYNRGLHAINPGAQHAHIVRGVFDSATSANGNLVGALPTFIGFLNGTQACSTPENVTWTANWLRPITAAEVEAILARKTSHTPL